ncbi:MAG TPA: VIT and VWA domain-containing protein [Phycisphaerales bacterium]|nr:VIT and VWA domain-containing protein [Phycisphaerales bacterium]HMP35917.1 VIT and VWA domain-containing protein [Phycisphaerales bacterium]
MAIAIIALALLGMVVPVESGAAATGEARAKFAAPRGTTGDASASAAGAHGASARVGHGPASLGDGDLLDAEFLVVPTAQVWGVRSSEPLPHLTAGRRRPPMPPSTQVSIERVALETTIREVVASTTIDLLLRNSGPRIAESVVLLPLPFHAAVTGMELEGLGSEGVAKLLPRDEARLIYDRIVRRVEDPALVEFAGWNLVRSSVFPVPAGGTQRIRITFEHLLEVDGDRVDLLLPRSETTVPGTAWSITVDASSERPIVEAYSPTHPLEVRRIDEHRLAITALSPRPVPGPFRLSLLRAPSADGRRLSATVLLSPDPAGGGGHFLVLGGLDPTLASATQKGTRAARELILAIDRSGSMRGEKLAQARDAALALVDALRDGDFLNVVDFSTSVSSLYDAPRLVDDESRAAARQFLLRMSPGGGTNIHDVLVECLGQAPSPAAVRTVLFLTDGIPTVGRTIESEIRAAVERGNRHERRVHAFGVGLDVNAPLLDRIGDLTRGSTTYVAPGDSIVMASKRLVRVLDGAALLAPTLRSLGPGRIADVLPAALPDLHSGDQLVVLGRYFGEEPLSLRLEGMLAAGAEPGRVAATVVVDPSKATLRNAFVGRLWATRQIAALADEVRQLTAPGAPGGPIAAGDPRMRELVEQIVAISLRWGILTEYTSFLAVEPDAAGGHAAVPMARREIEGRATEALDALATRARSGEAGVAQALNYNERKAQSVLNLDNCFVDSQLRTVTTMQVCQVADRGFFRRGDAWLDGAVIAAGRTAPARTIEFGSPEYAALVEALISAGRQAILGLRGDLYLDLDGETVLVHNAS